MYCVAEAPVSQRSEVSHSNAASPSRQHHESPSHASVSTSLHQSPAHQTVSPPHQPSAAISVAPVFSTSSPTHHRSSLTPVAAAVVQDPASCPVIPGRETAIEINKGKGGLGLSIVGGSDTLLVCASWLCFASLYIQWQWHNFFMPYLCQLFSPMVWGKLWEIFVIVSSRS